MSRLTTEFNIGAHGDDLYAALIAGHEGLTDAQSERLNARLVLLLMNHVGDPAVIEEAIRIARRGLDAPPPRKP